MPKSRRPRMRRTTSPELREMLNRTARVGARLKGTLVMFARPQGTGGDAENHDFIERLERGDPTILEDCLTDALDGLVALRDDARRTTAKLANH